MRLPFFRRKIVIERGYLTEISDDSRYILFINGALSSEEFDDITHALKEQGIDNVWVQTISKPFRLCRTGKKKVEIQ